MHLPVAYTYQYRCHVVAPYWLRVYVALNIVQVFSKF